MRTLIAFIALSATVGCYSAEFDAAAGSVFTCEASEDCDTNSSCLRGICTNDEGPSVNIVGPEENSVFAAGDAVVFPLTLSGTDLKLNEPNGQSVAGQGYLLVEVDGVTLPSRIISGQLSGTVSEQLNLGILDGGYHRLRVSAVGLDNEPYANPSAVADVGLWVNDGLPHVGIRSPWPGDTYATGEPLDVSVVCLNCTFIDPDLAAADRVDEPTPEGHTHIFFDRREGVGGTLDYPACLPDCNFSYANNGSIKPKNKTNQRSVEGVVEQVPEKAGALRVTASLNYTGHFPYPSDSLDPAVWSSMPELLDQLVFEAISINLED